MIPWLPILRDSLDLEFGADKPRIATLATVDEHHRPSARSIILRQIDDDGALHFVTDARSPKTAHLRLWPFAELVLWLPIRREQFRLAGPTTITTSADNPTLARQFWTQLTDVSRAMFLWPAPGHPRPDCDDPFVPAAPATTPIPDSFVLVTLRPDRADHLQLSFHPHRRTRWEQSSAWEPRSINP
ncbi:MAG TPA: pyridoxamine 5'-phosphate oxidase family protein [Tepidisphaeraceae bacterium]|jgi:PPOX class probable FMN-dependent enzyme